MSHNVPEGVAYGTVHGEFMSFAADRAGTAAGPDGVPDKIPMEGYVVITPKVETVRWPSLVPPITAVIQDVRCPLIEGRLYPPGTTPESAASVTPGVVLVATEQPEALPSTVQYTLTFDLRGIKRQPPAVTFNVPASGVVDLTTVLPAAPDPGVVVVVSTVDRERAEAAADVAEGFAGEAETALTSTLAAAVYELRGEGRPGSSATTIDALPGTYYTDTSGTAGAWRWLKTSPGSGVARWKVVHGDTGWRNIAGLLDPTKWSTGGSGFLRIKRVGSTVTVASRIASVSAVQYKIFTFPPGFTRANGYLSVGVVQVGGNLYEIGGFATSSDLEVSTASFPADTGLWGEWKYETNDTFPTTLPGTPA